MMRRVLCVGVIAASLLLVLFSPARAAGLKCAECGMLVDRGSKFYAWIVQDEGTLPFCDVGDLLVYLKKKSLSPGPARVKDYPGGDTIDADKAFFVHAENTFKTPMGWGIAAFKDRGDAAKFGSVLDFAGAIKAVK